MIQNGKFSFLVSSIANESNSNSLANQLGIHLILAKQKKWPPTVWQTHLVTRAYMRARRMKKKIKNREGFLM
jgi:hypothetical protein